MHSNGRNRLPALPNDAEPGPLREPLSASGLELLSLLEVARRGAYEVARQLDVTSQLRSVELVVQRALAFEESIAALLFVIEGPPQTRVNGRPRL